MNWKDVLDYAVEDYVRTLNMREVRDANYAVRHEGFVQAWDIPMYWHSFYNRVPTKWEKTIRVIVDKRVVYVLSLVTDDWETVYQMAVHDFMRFGTHHCVESTKELHNSRRDAFAIEYGM